MERRLHAQVAIVGGGPVGLLVAAELGEYGVRTVLLEAEPAVSERPRARVLHARALQGLARRGYFTDLVPSGAAGAEAETEAPFRFAGVPGLSIVAPASEPGPVLKRPQAELERLFEQRARAAGVRILREHRVTEVVQDQDRVRVVADGPSGRVEYAALYLVGADGGRSAVRELAGVPSQTHEATTSGLAALVDLDGADGLPPGWHSTPRGWIVAHDIPGEGTHIKTLDCSGPHPERHLPPTARELRAELARIAGKEIGFGNARWLSRFSDFARLAHSYRWGRVFLAGDSAHIHFPVGAQGLSTGVQDALNLSWKLALVVRGLARRNLLDTYDQERRPAAQRVIDNTRAQLVLMRAEPGTDALRALLAELMTGDRQSRHLTDLISGQDTVLPGHARLRTSWGGRFLRNMSLRTDGNRTDVIRLLRSGRPLLLGFGERSGRYLEQARPWRDVVRPVRLEPTAEAGCDALLLRPDGYVAWTSAPDGECLETAFAQYFGRRPAQHAGRGPAGHDGHLGNQPAAAAAGS